MPSSSILTKAMGLLDLVAASPTPLTLGEVTDKCGLPKSSTHRLLVLLRDAHALTYDADLQTYSPGSRLMRWGVQTQQKSNLVALASPLMKALCRETGMRVALSIMDEDAALFIHTVETGAPFRLAPRVGQHSPLHASAAGKLFLAGMSDQTLAELFTRYEFEQCTEFTIANTEELMGEIKQARQLGFAVSAREELRQTCGLAAPITNENNTTIAALSIWNVGGEDLLDDLKSRIAPLRETASKIRVSLGHAL
ncbi:IclR family transcriptional regulator [Shimia thalassica]|uniref:IclR family transcriptional regulator n=1 Tax=Shimia thalassica TaxID=1715693 RepID=UPI0026E168AC|nr:IclR family transcriptional regulator [Shimia thalassica]MDO6481429.1 IclR family transcriptional regulator [Shimia thalassica]